MIDSLRMPSTTVFLFNLNDRIPLCIMYGAGENDHGVLSEVIGKVDKMDILLGEGHKEVVL